ncbi:hypothetical protein AB0J90_13950 [Micromonospora sp. NPDC049523]|uniref:hypothetical protein n=1 Tax=Micromonospora sp. NPDC049523 TaxID=3155921 RepID=UPI00342E7ACE
METHHQARRASGREALFTAGWKAHHPVTTYAIGEGLAVRGEEVADAEPAVEAWLRRVGLLTR